MKKLILAACLLPAICLARDAEFANAPYMNPRLSIEERLENLISKMTVREMGEGGHMNTVVHMDNDNLFNVDVRPFVATVEGGVCNIMTCYDIVGEMPGILRGDLVNGFCRKYIRSGPVGRNE